MDLNSRLREAIGRLKNQLEEEKVRSDLRSARDRALPARLLKIASFGSGNTVRQRISGLLDAVKGSDKLRSHMPAITDMLQSIAPEPDGKYNRTKLFNLVRGREKTLADIIGHIDTVLGS